MTAWKGMTMKSLEKHPPKRLSLWFTVSSLPTFYFRPLSFHPLPSPRFPFLDIRPTYTFSRSSRSLFFIGRLPRAQTSSTRPRKTFRLSRRVKTGEESCTSAYTSLRVYHTLRVLPELCSGNICNTLAHGKMGAQTLLIYVSTKGCESETLDGSGYFIDIFQACFW